MEPTFNNFLREQVQLHGLTLSQLSQQTGVSERHLEALLEGQLKRLPAAPYVRGYLIKISHVLNLPDEKLWEMYKAEVSVKSSGAHDRLPGNRYAIRVIKPWWIVAGIAALFLIIFFSLRAGSFFGKPDFTLIHPSTEIFTTATSTIVFRGVIDPQDKLLIDQDEVPVNLDGTFEHSYFLRPGLNQVTFTVTKILGKEMTVSRQIIYEPEEEVIESEGSTSTIE